MGSLPRRPVETRTGHSLLRGLVSVWPLQFPSGGVVDLSDARGGNTLVDTGTVAAAAGPSAKIARATQFVRANSDYVDKADNASLSTGDISFTLAAWAYKDSSPIGEMYIFSKDNGAATGAEYGLLWDNVTNRFRFYITDSTRLTFNIVDADVLGAPSNAAWYHIVAWVDLVAATINIAVNGGAATSIAKTVTVVDTTTRFTIGGRSMAAGTDSFWDGRIAQGGFWKQYIPSQKHRQYLYNGGLGRQFRKNRGFY